MKYTASHKFILYGTLEDIQKELKKHNSKWCDQEMLSYIVDLRVEFCSKYRELEEIDKSLINGNLSYTYRGITGLGA